MSGHAGAAVAGLLSTLVLAAPVAAQTPVAAQAPTSAQAPAQTSIAHVHLAGTFLLDGLLTVADDVPGEHVGERVLRKWTFIAPCPTGSCVSVTLVRQRANGEDRLTLRRRSHLYYVGTGRFYAPLRCGSRTYAHGALVPFTIAVRISAAKISNGVTRATHVRATYDNRERANQTPCVTALGHDAARYHGHLVAS